MADGIARLASLKKPTVAVIRGQCYGASLALTLATDLRFAAEDAVFAITPAKLGALYLKSDMARLFEAVGRARSLEMIYTARPVGAPEAQSIGLINRAVPLAHFDETLVDLEKQIVTLSSFTMMTTKAMMRPSPEDPLAETDESLEWWLSAVRGRDFAEGVSAFLSRRPPRFV
jgi:enoyl-CoA hydratase/carnithine racemase